ncbi:MAG: metal-dependent hydrolase [Bacteroidota bacterium]
MDTLTHAALGASIGELTFGKKLGNQAPLWGAIAANVPDLDLLSGLFINRVEALGFHRGPTHSLVFCFVAAAILGYLLYKRNGKTSLQQWSWLMLLGLLSHVFLDCCNSIGAQLFYPFYKGYIAWGNIFYVDPVYTLLLASGLLLALRYRKDQRARRIFNSLGLTLSGIYLVFTFTNQAVANAVFTNALHLQGQSIQRKLTLPAPFNTFIWYTVAEGPSGFNLGYYNVLDDNYQVDFTFLPKHPLLDTLVQDPSILEQVESLTDGYFIREKQGDTLILRDLRCGINLPELPVSSSPEYFLSYFYSNTHKSGSVKTLELSKIWASLPRTWELIWEEKIPRLTAN